MKVNLLTFHRAINYGAILQCYALQKIFLQYGECEVIDYRSESIENRYRLFKGNNSLKQFIKKILQLKDICSKRYKFNVFMRDNIKLSKTYRSFADLSQENWNEDDVFCVGSDQVWNLDINGNDTAYFFEFVPSVYKKISYAASVGIELDEEKVNYYKEHLSGFEAISVRERTLQRTFLEKGISCICSIDPVFLLEKEEWEYIALKKEGYKPYILIYLLQKDEEFLEAAIRYAKENGLEVIIIFTGVKRSYKAKYVTDCSPNEFVSYILNADTVFTNSFHGISFSILLEKNFYYNTQKNINHTNSRINDIVGLFSLKSREFDGKFNTEKIQYEKIRELISKERIISKKYIQSMIK